MENTIKYLVSIYQNIVVSVGEQGDHGGFPPSLPLPLSLSEHPVGLHPVLTEDPVYGVDPLVEEENSDSRPHLLDLG